MSLPPTACFLPCGGCYKQKNSKNTKSKDYCRQTGLAGSTFGRRAVNDGKLASRLRNGGRITTETLDRIRAFMASPRASRRCAPAGHRAQRGAARAAVGRGPVPIRAPTAADDPQRNFRFFDNRQKYLLFVNTCSEKWVVASRVALELANIHPRPPAVRLFDAGVGDGTVLTRVMRAMHDRFPHMPFYVVGKEISLEDVRLTLQKMSDRFFEHPATVLVLTNLAYADAPWLAVKSLSAASSMVWHEVPLTGNTAHTFEQQITDLVPFLAENWKAGVSPRPAIRSTSARSCSCSTARTTSSCSIRSSRAGRHGRQLRSRHRVAALSGARLARLQGQARDRAARARARPGGRLIAIHSHGNDPGMEIIQKVWPGDNPFTTTATRSSRR